MYRLSPLVVIKKLYLVASALMWIHAEDLHAGNVLATCDDSAWRISDFGAASWMEESDGSPTRLKAFMYAAHWTLLHLQYFGICACSGCIGIHYNSSCWA